MTNSNYKYVTLVCISLVTSFTTFNGNIMFQYSFFLTHWLQKKINKLFLGNADEDRNNTQI